MVGSSEDTGGSSVIIKLIADDHIKDLRKRTITLTELNHTIPIGRASKVATKGFVAAADNAWFDSPVMSRNHAEIVADLDKKTVSIRDIGSLHGTFINGDKAQIDSNVPVEIRDGSQVTFGVPIWRNSESFAPATIKVGITHKSGTDRRPTPGSTFALPEYVDDESSDSSDDGSEEAEEELMVSHMQGRSKATIVDLTEARQQVDKVDLTDGDMSSNMDCTADNLIDLTSPPRAVSPDIEDEQENEEDLRVLHATAMILDKIVDNRSDRDSSDIGSPSSQDSDAEPQSLSLSDSESNSTESEIGMGDDRSDDDEGSNSDDQKADWDAEYSSDDDVLDEEDPDTAVWPEEEPANGPTLVHHGPSIPLDAPVPHTPRIDHPFSFAGPYPVPYYPMSGSAPVFESRLTLPSLFDAPARQPSPSDAALPKRSLRLPTLGPVSSYGSSAAEALGVKTGKHEFFAARAENRRRAFAPSRQAMTTSAFEAPSGYVSFTRPMMPEANHTVVEKPSVTEEAAIAEKPMDAAKPAVIEKPASVEKPAIVEKPASVEDHAEFENSLLEFLHPLNACDLPEKLESAGKPSVAAKPAAEESQPPAKPASAVIPKPLGANQTVAITPLLRTGDNFLNRPQSSVDLQLPALPGDDADEPISAYELQKRKLAAQKKEAAEMRAITLGSHHSQSSRRTPEFNQASRRTHVGISDIVDRSPVPAAEPEKEVPVTAKGKRKADEMAELTESEIQWEAAETKLMGHLRVANEAMLGLAPMDVDRPAASFQALVDDAWKGHIFPPPSRPQARTADMSKRLDPMNDVRAPKRLRLRKIAERLGYAALGGATVGAALVSTLIYTAPTFT